MSRAARLRKLRRQRQLAATLLPPVVDSLDRMMRRCKSGQLTLRWRDGELSATVRALSAEGSLAAQLDAEPERESLAMALIAASFVMADGEFTKAADVPPRDTGAVPPGDTDA